MEHEHIVALIQLSVLEPSLTCIDILVGHAPIL